MPVRSPVWQRVMEETGGWEKGRITVYDQVVRLVLEDGTIFEGKSFGAPRSAAGEVVFNTGMVGYPEALTDPSYYGQILVLTYPLVGNYGVPEMTPGESVLPPFESGRIQVSGLIVSNYVEEYSHASARQSLGEWLRRQNVPAVTGIDTRALTKKLREKGTMLGKIEFEDQPVSFFDPNAQNLLPGVSVSERRVYGSGTPRLLLVDCGAKESIVRSLLRRRTTVVRLPWDQDFDGEQFDGIVVSNGPGNPKLARQTIIHIRKAMGDGVPIFGICLGHQLMSLAAGANTYKLKYGHRSQNQPVQEAGGTRCFITSQNHGFAVDNSTLPPDWEPWFVNLNDGTNEGIRHRSGKFMSVQFHPEAAPGPVDTEFLFDQFLEVVRNGR